MAIPPVNKNDIPRCNNSSVRRAGRVEALRHLDPEGAIAGLDLDDREGLAIRAALKDVLIGAGL